MVPAGHACGGPLRTRQRDAKAIAAARIAVLAVVLFLAIIYLKLGYFVIFLLPLGAVAAVLITRRQRAGYPVARSSLAAIVTFCASYALVSLAAIRNREETRQLAWEIVEQPAQRGVEVRLDLGGGHYLLSPSSELAGYLRSRSSGTVGVSLRVTKTLGCFQSFGEPRIEGWGVMPLAGYEAVEGGAGPWEDHWWCP